MSAIQLHNGWICEDEYDTDQEQGDDNDDEPIGGAQAVEPSDERSWEINRILAHIRRAQIEANDLAKELFGRLQGDELEEAVEDVLQGEVRNCRTVVACVAERNGRAVRPLMCNFAGDEDIAVKAASSHPDGFGLLPEAMRGNEKVVEAAVDCFPGNIRHVSQTFLNDARALLRVVAKNPTVAEHLTIGVRKHPCSDSPSSKRRRSARVDNQTS